MHQATLDMDSQMVSLSAGANQQPMTFVISTLVYRRNVTYVATLSDHITSADVDQYRKC